MARKKSATQEAAQQVAAQAVPETTTVQQGEPQAPQQGQGRGDARRCFANFAEVSWQRSRLYIPRANDSS